MSTNKGGFNVHFHLKRNHDNVVCTWSRTINRRDSDFEVCCKKAFVDLFLVYDWSTLRGSKVRSEKLEIDYYDRNGGGL